MNPCTQLWLWLRCQNDGLQFAIVESPVALPRRPDAACVIEHPVHVTITHTGMRGFFAVLLVWNPECGGFYEPRNSGFGSYKTRAEAEPEARALAEAEGVGLRL